VMGGEAITAEQITALSRLPARDVLHQQLVAMVASPITGLVRGLNALIAGLAIQLQQIAEQGLVGGGEAPAAPAEEAEAEEPPAEAEQAAQDEQAEEEAAQSAEGEETESSSEDSAPTEDAAADEAATDQETDAPSEGDEDDE
jgi:hypothetical protein